MSLEASMNSLLARIAVLAVAAFWAVQPALCREFCCGPTPTVAKAAPRSCCHKTPVQQTPQHHNAPTPDSQCCCQPATTPAPESAPMVDTNFVALAVTLATLTDAVSTQVVADPSPPALFGPPPRILQCVWRI